MLSRAVRNNSLRAFSRRERNNSRNNSWKDVRCCFSSIHELDPNQMQITNIASPSQFEFKPSMLFGERYSDHLLSADWVRSEGWGAPRIEPFDNLSIHPAASSLHYGVQCFDGLKVYRGKHDDKLRMFRPIDHAKRFAHSAARMTMPAIPPEVLVELMERFIRHDKRFVPNDPDCSMYLRPTMIGTTAKLGVSPPESVKFFTIANPCGAYFQKGLRPMALLADPTYVRAWEGSAGGAKVGPNYGPVMLPQQLAHQKGFTQPMWLYPTKDGDYQITECGTLNLFVLWKKPGSSNEVELVTAPVSDLILPGINRLSVVELVKQDAAILSETYGKITLVERPVLMSEFCAALEKGDVFEFFGTGTASNVVSVDKMHFNGKDYQIPVDPSDPNAGAGPLALRLRTLMTEIQNGTRANHEWAPVIET